MPCWPLRGPPDQWSLNIAGLAVPTLTATTPPKSCDGCGKKEFDNIMKPSR